MTPKKSTIELRSFHIFTLILVVSLSSVGAITLSSALPFIARDLSISKEETQRLISLYMMGFAIGPLFYGPLSNRWGRKPLILLSIALFAGGSLGCLFSFALHSFRMMLFFRLVMALAGGGCLKMCWNMAADVFPGKALIRISSYYVLSFSLAPPLSIAIGGFLTQYFGWPSIFLFLALYSALLFFFSYRLPRTLREEAKEPLILKAILKKYRATLKDSFLVMGSLILGLVTSAIYLFGTEAPFISAEKIGLSPDLFGAWSLLPYLGMFLGGMSSSSLSTKCKTSSLFKLGLLIFFLSALAMVFFFFHKIITTWTLFLPVAVLLFGSSLVYCSTATLALSRAKDRSYATSIMNSLNLGTTFAFILLLEHLPTKHLLVFPLLLWAITLLTGAAGFPLHRKEQAN